jgi:cellulose synthase/poly-beta-1,6-N-acetylglucosamine synthase-like glycosyltransferase
MQWRLKRFVYAALDVTIAYLAALLLLPASTGWLSGTVLCVALVFAGATPMLASAVQWGVVGFHCFFVRYRRLRPHYPRVAVIVPAWNEGHVVGATIEHLLAMEYPAERLRVFVVDDASTDHTPAVVAQKSAEHPGRVHHLRRARGGEGKAHTLNHGIERVLGDDWAEAVLIMDADVLFERSALRRMARHLADPAVGAVTAYIKEGSRDGNYLTKFVAFEYLTAQAGSRRAQNIIGALACLAGGAQLHSRANLLAIGGRIDTSSLAEDTVTTFTTQMFGRRVVFEGNAIVWAEEPGDVAALWKQRLRWGRGNVQVSLQFASIWGRGRKFRWRTLLPFALLWFTVLLMPMLMLGAAAGLMGLYMLNAPLAWSAFTCLWIWHTVIWLFGTLMAFRIDPATARQSWLQGICFPGLISVGIMVYAIYPPLLHGGLDFLAHRGLSLGAKGRAAVTIFLYTWCFVCVPVAYLARVCAERARWRWLAPVVIYVAGYGSFLAAVTIASYLKELFNAAATWDKTVKVGRVSIPAVAGRGT